MNHTESILKWGVFLVLGFLALKWFTSLLSNVVSDGSQTPYNSGVPYAPGGYVYPPYYTVTPWSPYNGRGRGSRWTYGGR
jgi:hypothetical protein